jgi:hypothetical protein
MRRQDKRCFAMDSNVGILRERLVSPPVRVGFYSASQNRTPNLTSHINTAFGASSSVFPRHAVAIRVERNVPK